MNAFDTRVQKDCNLVLFATEINTVQVNIGFRCNQSCVHCHLGCGPDREEVMTWETMESVIETARSIKPDLIDITGGAPEIHPHIRRFISELTDSGCAVQVRTNLTAMMESDLEETIQFFKNKKVALVASMPCYTEENVNRQRGSGTYEKSVMVLQTLNRFGYGKNSEMPLNLVYNPGGPALPPDQGELEADYKREFHERWGIQFTNLLTITNMPIGRFWMNLEREEKADEYMDLLVGGFNRQTVETLMCRTQINVGWDGTLYDCDFNLALDIPISNGSSRTVEDLKADLLIGRSIATGMHCFGCTAGAGSSCGGAIIPGILQVEQ